MKIKVKTEVYASVEKVKSGFTQDLFRQLNPPFPPVTVSRFDGCRRGDRVVLELNFLFFRQTWESLITSHVSTATEFSFVDEGIILPFFLKYWKHHHVAIREGDTTVIIDDITFRTPTRLTDYLLYPILYLQFLYRRPIYKKYFKN